MPDYTSRETAADFQDAAAPVAPAVQPPQVMVTLPLDADVMAYFQSETEPSDWQGRVNDLLRFFMDTNLQREADWARDDQLDSSESMHDAEIELAAQQRPPSPG